MEFENNYEIIENEEITDLVNFDENEPETEEESGLSTLAAMAIGAGVTAAAFGVVNLVKRGIRKLKAKKVVPVPVEDEEDEAEFEEVDVDDDNK